MLFLVISTPPPTRPRDMKDTRLQWRAWLKDLRAKKKVVTFYPRVGRGAVVLLDVASNDELHELLTQWLNIIPVSFDIYPLPTPSFEEEVLKR